MEIQRRVSFRFAALVTASTLTVGGLSVSFGSAATASAATAWSFTRVSGADRYATAAAAAQAAYPTGATSVVVADGLNFPDALAAAYLAGQVNGPILLTAPDSLPAATSNEIVTLGAATIYIVGGEASVSAAVATQLGALNVAAGHPTVTRISGASRYDTDQQIAQFGTPGQVSGNVTAFVASGVSFPDALAASPIAAALHLPILLTTPTSLAPQASAAIAADHITQVVIVGGTAAISAAVASSLGSAGVTVTRIAGTERTQTAADLASWAQANAGFSTTRVAVARGDNAGGGVDALGMGPLAGMKKEPLLLAASPTIEGAGTTAWLLAHGSTLTGGDAVGGTAALSPTLLGGLVADATGTAATSWSSQEAPLPAGAAASATGGLRLGNVSCPAPGTCVAVGGYTDTSGVGHPVVETLSGGIWTATDAPVPPTAASYQYTTLVSVSCPAAGVCFATGDYLDSVGGNRGFIDMLSNGTWTSIEAPLPSGGLYAQGLDAITCPTTDSCATVGGYAAAGQVQRGLVETLDGGSWTATDLPLPAASATNPLAVFGALVCPAAGSCITVGVYTDTGGHQQQIFETLTGGQWTSAAVARPADASGLVLLLSDLACSAPGKCVLSGHYQTTNGSDVGLIETLSGGTWKVSTAALPANAAGPVRPAEPVSSLAGLDCTFGGSCVAVGTYLYKVQSIIYGLADVQNGATWSGMQVPLPAGANAQGSPPSPQVVACQAAGTCVLLGFYGDTGGTEQVLIGKLGGGVWTASTISLPANARAPRRDINFYDVSCPAAGNCAATGYYTDNVGTLHALLASGGA